MVAGEMVEVGGLLRLVCSLHTATGKAEESTERSVRMAGSKRAASTVYFDHKVHRTAESTELARTGSWLEDMEAGL